VLEHVDLDAEAVQGGLEASVDLVRAQPARGIDVGQAGDGDVLEQHGRTPGSLWEQASLAPGTSNPGRSPGQGPPRVRRRSAAAAPDREALRAILEAVQGLDDVAAQARGLVAGQDLQLVADPQAVALVEPDLLLDRDLDLAALLAGRGRG